MVGLFALGAFAAFGILRDKDFPGAVSWSLLLFLGAVYALPDIIEDNKMIDWIASFILPTVQRVSSNVLLLLVVLCVVTLVLRFFDPGAFLVLTVLFLPVAKILRDQGAPHLCVRHHGSLVVRFASVLGHV